MLFPLLLTSQVQLVKEVSWDRWEELATNIKHLGSGVGVYGLYRNYRLGGLLITGLAVQG